MKASDHATSAARTPLPRWLQTRWSLLILISAFLALAAVSGLAHSTALREWFHRRAAESWAQRGGIYAYRPGFADVGGYLLLEAIPAADESQGGVTFLGASVLGASLMPWSLTGPEARLVRNYAVPGMNHTDLFHFTRFLAEQEGLFDAKGGRSVVVLGLFYGDTIETRHFPSIFRYGLYTYDRGTGIRVLDLSPVTELWRREKGRMSHILRTCATLRLRDGLRLDVKPRPPGRKQHPVEAYKSTWTAKLNAAGADVLSNGVGSLERLIRFATERDGQVVCVLLPLPSWHRELPFPARYERLVRDLCDRLQVPFHDLSSLLTDAEFADHAHPNYDGSWKVHRELMGIARPYLARLAEGADGGPSGEAGR